MLAPFYCVITKLVETSNTAAAEEEKRIGRRVVNLIKPEWKQNQQIFVLLQSATQSEEEEGKPLVTLCCSFTKRRKPVEGVLVEGAVPRPGCYLSMGDFSGLLCREIFYLLKNLIKPTFVPES